MNYHKIIAFLIRLFHVSFWLILMIGGLFVKNILVSYLCLVLMLTAIILWKVVGFCFLHIIENEFDPISDESTDSYFNEMVSKYTGLEPKTFGRMFESLIYAIVFIVYLRIYLAISSV